MENSHKNKHFKAGISSVCFLHIYIPIPISYLQPYLQTNSHRAPWQTFEIQTALKYFSPLFFSICLTKAANGNERTFYRFDMTRKPDDGGHTDRTKGLSFSSPSQSPSKTICLA